MKTFKYKEHKFKTFTVVSYQFEDECEVAISRVKFPETIPRLNIGPRFAIGKTKLEALRKLRSHTFVGPLRNRYPSRTDEVTKFMSSIDIELQNLIYKQPIESS